jgi:DNA modification methylase
VNRPEHCTSFREEILADGVRLILGDCRDVLPTLGPVDAVVTDPPYGIAHSSNHGASWEGTQIANDGCLSARDAVAVWCGPSLPQAYFGTWKREKPSGTRATLIWDKGPASGMGDLSFPWKGSHEEIYILGDGWSGRRDEGVLRGSTMVTWESAGRDHPMQKPVWLIEAILAKLPSATTILDPFMGSGTTGVAAVKKGKRFVGIEIDPAHFETALRRISEALAAPSFFIERPAPARQEALL